MIDFESLVQPAIRTLRAYDPGHDLVALRRQFAPPLPVELGSNENPYGPSPLALGAAQSALSSAQIYPDPLGGDLKRSLAAHHNVTTDQIILGNGSHELLMQFAQVFAGPGTDVIASQYGFAVYAIAAKAVGAQLVLAPAFSLDHDMPRGHNLSAITAAITTATRLVYLSNPNNPTGTWFEFRELRAFLRSVPSHVIVIVDEAYAEFLYAQGWQSALSLLSEFPNLVVTRTFSKAYALAGLRVGYALGHADFIALMERIRESFNVNSVGLAAAQAALNDVEYLQTTLAANDEQRDSLRTALESRGYFVYPSRTNFLLVAFGDDCARIESQLMERGIVLRPMGGYGMPECLRITVGTGKENDRLLAAIDSISG